MDAPSPPGSSELSEEIDQSASCQWTGCGELFTDLRDLVEHIVHDHVGGERKGSRWVCEWGSCPRRGLPQGSRFALVSHIRSHTGEKPYVCKLAECDKSFTRSDALAKHMRQQHNISPPIHGRGGPRARRRGDELAEMPPITSANGSFNTFKIEPTIISYTPPITAPDPDASPRTTRRQSQMQRQFVTPTNEPDPLEASREPILLVNHYSPDRVTVDDLPAHLQQHYDHTTNTVLGRSPAMVMYLIEKAKYRYVLQQHEELRRTLQEVEWEEKRLTEAKEDALDEFLRKTYGDEAEKLISHRGLPPEERVPEPYPGYQPHHRHYRQRPSVNGHPVDTY